MKFLKDSYKELEKVTWPTKNHAISITVLTVVFTVIATGFLTVVDGGFKEFYNYLIDISPKSQAVAPIQPQIDTSAIKLTDQDGNEIDSSAIQINPVSTDALEASAE
ncbi:preprotein translocase subunit SecE [bacterium]|nr:preprotein translocase subunit SecE [bacterium]|tara:strand:- start:8408 stop:8728 length:321 start_codon:yes stop_codon:yes gene_type:complete